MDLKEQQDQEIEALESIFPQEFNLIQKDPLGVFSFDLKTKDYDGDPNQGARLVVKFTYTEKYPDEIPQCEVEEIENFGDSDELIDYVNSIASDNLGMPMIYTLVAGLMEKLEVDNENRKKYEAEEKERKEKERELEELKRFEGIKVTVDTFLKWKGKFDQEMSELKRQDIVVHSKLTGKQLFERNESLFESDLQFTENDENIEVDESLFQSMDGLEIDESEFNLPDEDN